MPLSPTFFVRTPPSRLASPGPLRLNNVIDDPSKNDGPRGMPTSSAMSPDSSIASIGSNNSLRRPPLPPNHFKTRPLNKLAVIKPNQTARIVSRSPSPNLSSSSRCCRSTTPLYRGARSSSVLSTSSRSSDSPTPRRTYPQASPRIDERSDLAEISSKEQAPVVFDASLNFVLGIEKQKVRQSFRPTASHLEPATASSLLSSRIAQFLQRTDHIMEEWRGLGHRDDAGELESLTSLPHNDRHRTLGRSKSATNIMIKGFQYFSRASSVARSPSGSTAKLSCLEEDRTLSECNDDEVDENTSHLPVGSRVGVSANATILARESEQICFG